MQVALERRLPALEIYRAFAGGGLLVSTDVRPVLLSSLESESSLLRLTGPVPVEVGLHQSIQQTWEMRAETTAALVRRGEQLFEAEPLQVTFTRNPDANALLNDLAHHPHAFLIGCLMDRQVRAERAWLIPHLMSQKLGGFSFGLLRALSESAVLDLLTKPDPLHRFSEEMSPFTPRFPG